MCFRQKLSNHQKLHPRPETGTWVKCSGWVLLLLGASDFLQKGLIGVLRGTAGQRVLLDLGDGGDAEGPQMDIPCSQQLHSEHCRGAGEAATCMASPLAQGGHPYPSGHVTCQASLLLIPLSPKGAFSHAQKFLLVHNPELLLMAVTCDGLAAPPLPPMPLTPQLTCLFGITSITPSHQLIIDNKRSESMDDVC